MRLRSWSVAAAVVALGFFSSRPSARAEVPEGAVVARVGDHAITAKELIRRIAAVPPFQLRTFGDTPDQIKRNFLERVIVREELLAQGALAAKFDERDELRERIRGILRNHMISTLRAEAAIAHPITMGDIKAYYDANMTKFRAPPRVSVWRIQVASEKEAQDVLDEMKKDPSTKHWSDLARERSLDKTSYMRSGSLGFVAADGTTTEEGVRIEPIALAAVAKVKDNAMVQQPVAEGDRWDVLWRRQSMKGVERALELEVNPIRQVLTHQRTDDSLKTLLDRLRKEYVSELHPEELDSLDVEASGDLALQRRPGTLGAHRTSQAQAAPHPGAPGPR